MKLSTDLMSMLKQFYLGEMLMFSQYMTPSRTPEIVSQNGYELESHTVQTQDGYLLTLHRIPNPQRPVAFLMHCMFCSSADYVCIGRGKALAFLLHDAGYDVWMGNARGNTYSRKHITYSPDSRPFWDFTWHEIGMYDLPAMIDYTLDATGEKRLNYIGHSQGTTAFFVMASQRPQYNAKVRAMHAMAPIAFMSNCKGPAVRLAASVLPLLQNFAHVLGIREFLTSNVLLRTASGIFCHDSIWTQTVCTAILNFISGYNPAQTNTTILPFLFSNTPAGGSIDLLFHYGQLIQTGKFRQFDHGRAKNLRVYKQAEPPDYDLSKITAPVILHWSSGDWLSDTKDVEILQGQLRNLAGAYQVEDSDWSHLDYTWGIDADRVVYRRVIGLLDRQEQDEWYSNMTLTDNRT